MKHLMRPLLLRMGTLLGASMGGYGLADNDINAVAAGAVALAGIAVDLVTRHFFQKEGQ